MNAASKKARVEPARPEKPLPGQSSAQPLRPLTVARLKAIAWSLVQINQRAGLELTIEDSERFACRILLSEEES